MIDAAFQAGDTESSTNGLLNLLTGRYPNKDIYLSVFKGNDVAAGLYKEFGFRFNGEKDIHGEDVMVMRITVLTCLCICCADRAERQQQRASG